MGGQDSGFCVLPTQPVGQKHFSGTFLHPQFNGLHHGAPTGCCWFVNVEGGGGGLALPVGLSGFLRLLPGS